MSASTASSAGMFPWMSAMTAIRILYPQLVWLPSNAAPDGDANQHGNNLRATDEQQTTALSGASGSTTACLNFCNVFTNSLLHSSAELACHLLWTTGFACNLCQYGSHSLQHRITLFGRILDNVEG